MLSYVRSKLCRVLYHPDLLCLLWRYIQPLLGSLKLSLLIFKKYPLERETGIYLESLSNSFFAILLPEESQTADLATHRPGLKGMEGPGQGSLEVD